MTLLRRDRGIPEINRYFANAIRGVMFSACIISLLTNRPARYNAQVLYVFRLFSKTPSPRHKSVQESGLILSTFLNLDPVLNEWSASISCHLTSKKETPCYSLSSSLGGPQK